MGNKLAIIILAWVILMQVCCKSNPADIITKNPGDTPTHQFTGRYLMYDSVYRYDSVRNSREIYINRLADIFLDSTGKYLVYGADTFRLQYDNVYEKNNVGKYNYFTVTVTADSLFTHGFRMIDTVNYQTDLVTGFLIQ
ncbi:MAG: hypothetical protein H0X33_05530 [Taibaiella sp.]|nr:hypothetical protein [Taibaiella sp.]